MPTRPIPTAPSWDYDDEPTAYEAGPTFRLGGEVFHCMAVPPLGALWRLEGTNIIDRRRGQILSAVPDAIGFVEDVMCIELPAEVQPGAEPVIEEKAENVEGEPVIEEKAENVEGEPAARPDVPAPAMVPCDDVERWKVLIEDKRRPIEASRLAKIVNDLYAYYSNRPTTAS